MVLLAESTRTGWELKPQRVLVFNGGQFDDREYSTEVIYDQDSDSDFWRESCEAGQEQKSASTSRELSGGFGGAMR